MPELRIGPLLAVLSLRGYQANFISPAPGGPFTEIEAELDRVRATPPAGRAALREHPELSGDPAQVRDLLADMLGRAWSALVEPWWPRLRDVLDADITFRARQLANAGVTATLNDLDSKVSWRDGVLRFAIAADQELDVAGTELVLIPSVFAWPGAAASFDPPAVVYSARGIAHLWQPPVHPDGDLARLIGKTRAALLRALAEPSSSTGLAARCGVPVSSVSEHLAVLRAAGLVSTSRSGRFLLHQRTALGIALSAGS